MKTGGSKKTLIIVIAAALVLLAVIGGVAFFLLDSGEEEEQASSEEVTEVKEPEAEVEIPEPEAPIYVKLKPFTTTLGSEASYLKISMQFKMGSDGPRGFLESRLAEVKDSVIAVLQTTDVKDFEKPGWRERLKERIIRKVALLFPEEPDWEDPKPIRKILFEEFLMQ